MVKHKEVGPDKRVNTDTTNLEDYGDRREGGNTVSWNDSFSYKEIFKSTPKATKLMRVQQSGRNGGIGLVYTYHGDLGVLDMHAIFDSVIANAHNMYDLHQR